jgi:hypothetical protein
MVDHSKRYVQERLFEAPLSVGKRAPMRRIRASHVRLETRDPAVAEAYEAAHQLGHSVKLGLARIIASRSPEERAAIRALFERPRVA